ncbi:hypothetical protein [Massilia sp. CCM 8734]|uniref:hypothetical protein n=1 Tax=Massilia sp. CCM 8734 TaxID=2609283 RepID=UPI00141D8C13|nr:hypothetical protein [Massilia sp. CCM 8734]NHZ95808.1 hypothetical protein [Massilia sp. CCM 8734]
MKILPHYKEDEGAKCSHSISLRDNMGVLSKEEAKTVAAYMESCTVIGEWLSNVKDPMTNEMSIPSRTWSDGVYVWDSSHIHHVKKYRARLPADFLAHVRMRLDIGFDTETLVKDALRTEFELMLNSLANGDASCYASY